MSGAAVWANPVRVLMGPGAADRLGEVVGDRRALVVTTEGTRRRLGERLLGPLGRGVSEVVTGVAPNPTVASCQALFDRAGAAEADVVVAVGGGSVLDSAKALVLQRAAGKGPEWLSQHLRDGEPVPEGATFLPLVAVPTTAGTGSEVTPWGTVWDEQSGRKHSVDHPALFPEAALVEPSLTVSVPEDLTVATGLDALSHAMEAVWNRNANPVSDALARRAVELLAGSLDSARRSPDDLAAREAVQTGSLLAGLAFSNTRTALAHSISYPLTATFGLLHGLACSFTLPEVLRLNAGADEQRCGLIAGALGAGSIDAAAERIYGLFERLDLGDRVRERIPEPSALDRLNGPLLTSSRSGNNLAEVDEGGARKVLDAAYATVCR